MEIAEDRGSREVVARAEQLVDRYWFLVRRRRGPEQEPAGTVVLRDGESVVITVEARRIGWPDGTLLFRLRAPTTPCAGCVERALGFGYRHAGRPLTPADVREVLRVAVDRCAASGEDPAHGPASSDVPSLREAASPASDPRRAPDLWLVL